MPRIVPAGWMPEADMRRVITHWTAGGYLASSNDEEHYHILIEKNGGLVRGDHSIKDNESTADDDYAAHTRGLNSRSIGVTVCAMAGAKQGPPLNAGNAPMLQVQWETMAIVVADLCERYGIAITENTVLGHGEVVYKLGITQSGKWDPMVLPWAPALSREQVGDLFRELVQFHRNYPSAKTPLKPMNVLLNGNPLTEEAFESGGITWCPWKPLFAAKPDWKLLSIDRNASIIRIDGADLEFDAVILRGDGYVGVRNLCNKLGAAAPVVDKRTVQITLA